MKKLFFIVLSCIAFDAKANDEFFISLGLGLGEIDVAPDYQISDENDSNDTLNYQLLLGYQFKNKIQIEVGHNSRGSLDMLGLGDSSSMSENVLLLGYGFDITPSFQITPRLGYSSWLFESDKGWFLNAGSEEEYKDKGNQLIYSLSLSHGRFFTTYQSVSYDFGNMKSLVIGVELDL